MLAYTSGAMEVEVGWLSRTPSVDSGDGSAVGAHGIDGGGGGTRHGSSNGVR